MNALLAASAPVKVQQANDPRACKTHVHVLQTFQFQTQFAVSGPASLDITPAYIMTNAVPGGTTFWNSVRVNKVACWGQSVANASLATAANGIRFDVAGHSDWGQPATRFVDDGVFGQSRPKLAIALGALQRMRYFGPAETDTLVTVTGTPGEILTLQFSLELISFPR